ncbi:hypothetical protein GCM10023213_17710 [Prosthecobacter algae]|uniref:Plasmid stabilization system protein ParE n=1 Tax=Prosthecobacter algae TaxID=1144682 RepID=A0ABP9P3T9_9BACT
MYKLRTHPEADLELEESIRYLSEQTLWQASRFIDAYAAALLKIRQHPECAHFAWNPYRRFNLTPFSYALIYRHEGDTVFIIAVAHTKRHPDYWKTRI